MVTAYGTIFQICFDYLNFDELVDIPEMKMSDISCVLERENNYHLLDYAAINWPVHHTLQCKQRATDSWKAAHSLYNISLPR